MIMAQAKYKPLLFTTTIRNPERFKDFMYILFKYNGQVLTEKLLRLWKRYFHSWSLSSYETNTS